MNKYLKPIDDELDLHGKTKIEATIEIVDFLSYSKSKNYKKLKIITGRGIHSKDGIGILKKHVEDFLLKNGYVFSNAKINEGGEGAIIIHLD